MKIEILSKNQETSSLSFTPTQLEIGIDALKSFASYLMVPFWNAEASFHYCLLPFHPGEYGQELNKVYEYVKRFFIALFALPVMTATLPLVLAAFALTGLARSYESTNYRYFSGHAAEVRPEKPKFLHLNLCGFYGGLPYVFGGVIPANERLKSLIQNMQTIDADLLFLCECNRMLTPTLYAGLKEYYAHFFVDIGLNAWGMENALFFAARVPIVSAPSYHPFAIKVEGNQQYMMRGFFVVETYDKRYIYTHLHPEEGTIAREIRQKQLDAIQSFIEEKPGNKPWILLGDLNINRLEKPSCDYEKMLDRGYKDYFAKHYPTAFTASDRLNYHIKKINKKAAEEVTDYILVYDEGKHFSLQIDLFDTYHERFDLCLSDHKGLIGIG